ncbi:MULTISPECIES: response regulator [Paenibacillus]|uniref:response regulator n=1 Tax=Paenibacillus TaxID=44249 RepID=UPI0022B88900|nr:response regulator [Paenibacillus caseinilyticus]MCZ8520449.1 response regulator [Paenibacillus caseinilyticus]
MILRALLADDEPLIVETLRTVIPWASYGIDVVGEAENGAMALGMVKELLPDLVLCDIRMPKMDGLAFLEQTSLLPYDCHVIMLTGFQEFDYARKALQFGAKDFILKPIHYEELKGIIARMADEIRQTKREKQKELEQWKHFKHAAYEKYLHDVLMDYTKVPPQLFHGGEPAEAALEFAFLLVHLDDHDALAGTWTGSERKLYYFAVRNVLEVALLPYGLDYCVVQSREGEWCVLIQGDSPATWSEEAGRRWSAVLIEAVRSHVRLTVSVSICPCMVAIEELSGILKQLQRRLQVTEGTGQTVALYPEGGSRRSAKQLVLSAQEYIADHLGSDLGLDEVARRLGMSGSHFSVLFKQQTGETFLEHVTRLRIERAKLLLSASGHSIMKISQMVGYGDRRYFNKVFCRLEGMSPSGYRQACGRAPGDSGL